MDTLRTKLTAAEADVCDPVISVRNESAGTRSEEGYAAAWKVSLRPSASEILSTVDQVGLP